jgi:hypothetical protein
MSKSVDELRKQLVALLEGGNAHVRLEDAVKDLPAPLRGKVPKGLPYSAWQLLEHLRIAQDDILCFSTNYDGSYQSPPWPEGYWPASPAPPDAKAWDRSLRQIRSDRKRFAELISDPKSDLFKPFPWGEGQNLLREALLIADHAAYHLGQIVLVRRLLKAWPE